MEKLDKPLKKFKKCVPLNITFIPETRSFHLELEEIIGKSKVFDAYYYSPINIKTKDSGYVCETRVRFYQI